MSRDLILRRHFSLRRRLVVSLLSVFLLGVAATAVFFRWELREIQHRLTTIPTGSTAVSVQFSQMVEEDVEFLGFILVPFTMAAIGMMLFITQWSLSGIQRASQRATEIDVERLDARLELEEVPNEVVPLVRAVNGSLDRLADAYKAERRLTQNAAHELRTPLTVLQTRLQSAKFSETIDWVVVERDLGQLERVIAQLLDLACKESARGVAALRDRQSVNLARVLRESAAQVLPIAERANRAVEVDAPDQVMVDGSADDLRDMLRNLFDNALQHGRGSVRATLQKENRNQSNFAIVTVIDEGRGIPESLHDAAFERFRKLSSQSHGAGLGLAIVREVARNHGGDARFTSVTHGRIEIVLPLSSESATG